MKRPINISTEYKKYVKDKCERCESREYLHVHHKNKNHDDNSMENIQTLCRTCHAGLHALEKINRGIQPRELTESDMLRNIRNHENIVSIQIKNKTKIGSKCITIHGTTIEDVYQRLFFLYDELGKVDEYVTIKHYKKKSEE